MGLPAPQTAEAESRQEPTPHTLCRFPLKPLGTTKQGADSTAERAPTYSPPLLSLSLLVLPTKPPPGHGSRPPAAGNGARAVRPVNSRRSAEPHCGIAGSSRGGVCQVGAGPCSSLPPKYSMGPTHPTTTQKRQRRKREQKNPNKAWRIFWKA